jgi:cell division transport system permease protein
MMRGFGFFLRETFQGIRRHATGSITTFIQAFMSLWILGICLVFIIIVNHFVGSFLSNLEMAAFLADDVTEEQATELSGLIGQLSGVREVEYRSKLEAFAFMQQRTSMDISDLIETNPLPASLLIKITSPRVADGLAEDIGLLEGVDDVRYGTSELQRILPIFYVLELISFFFAIFTAGVTLVTIVNAIRLAVLARRREIRIMQLVGATGWFIRLPFLLEGLIYGVGGAALALALVALAYRILIVGMSAHAIYNPWTVDFRLMMSNLAIMMLVLGGLIGVIASLIAVGKHLEEDLYRPQPHREGVVT